MVNSYRVPYNLAGEILKHLPESTEKDELKRWMEIASRRSKELAKVIKEADLC